MRGKFMSNGADNKTPREFFRITSGLLVRYTRRSRMTRQKCSSGVRWWTRFSMIYRSTGKMVSPAGESGDPEMQFTLWLTTNRLLANTRDAYVHPRMQTRMYVQPRVCQQMHLARTHHPCSLRQFLNECTYVHARRDVQTANKSFLYSRSWLLRIVKCSLLK